MPPRAPDAFAYGSLFQEAWAWNGLPLQSAYGAWNLATMGGSRFSVPVYRGQNYEVPYRSGQAYRQKFPDSRTVTLAFWADGQGQHSTGTYPAADQRLAFNNNLQQIRQAFFQMNANGSVQGQLQRNWYLTQGTPKLVTSTAMAELAGSMDLQMNGRTSAGFSVDLLLSDPHFYGALQTVACTGASTTVTGLGEGVAGLGYPSAVAGFTVTLSVAATVTNTTAGVSFAVAGGPSFPVTVDILNGTVTDNGGANQLGSLSHSGARAWMAVLPGTNTISVSAGTATFRFNDCYV
jgi:hypothetical protein